VVSQGRVVEGVELVPRVEGQVEEVEPGVVALVLEEAYRLL